MSEQTPDLLGDPPAWLDEVYLVQKIASWTEEPLLIGAGTFAIGMLVLGIVYGATLLVEKKTRSGK